MTKRSMNRNNNFYESYTVCSDTKVSDSLLTDNARHGRSMDELEASLKLCVCFVKLKYFLSDQQAIIYLYFSLK